MTRQSSAEWRKLIVEAYIDLLSEKPYYKIKVSDLCAQSGVPRSTFYTIFDSADDCLEGIEKTLLGLLSLKSQPLCPAEDVPGLSIGTIARWFDTCFQHERVLAALTGINGDPYFERRLRNQLRSEMLAYSKEDYVSDNDRRPYAIENLVGSYITLLTFSLHLPNGVNRISSEELASIASLARIGYHLMVKNASHVSGEKLTGGFPMFKDIGGF